MTQITVRFHSQEGIDTEVSGRSKGKLTVKRVPSNGVKGGMGVGGREIFC